MRTNVRRNVPGSADTGKFVSEIPATRYNARDISWCFGDSLTEKVAFDQ